MTDKTPFSKKTDDTEQVNRNIKRRTQGGYRGLAPAPLISEISFSRFFLGPHGCWVPPGKIPQYAPDRNTSRSKQIHVLHNNLERFPLQMRSKEYKAIVFLNWEPPTIFKICCGIFYLKKNYQVNLQIRNKPKSLTLEKLNFLNMLLGNILGTNHFPQTLIF